MSWLQLQHFGIRCRTHELLAKRHVGVPEDANDEDVIRGMVESLILQTLRDDENTNLLRMHDKEFGEVDARRMIVEAEESNADFEAFVIRDLPGRPKKLLGFPVYYSNAVQEGEVFGGMWSHGKLEHIGNHLWFNPVHAPAFVRMIGVQK